MLKTAARMILFMTIWFDPIVMAGGMEWSGKVVGVTDGDTISVLREGQPAKIRLYGIDCPEKRQDHGTAARRFTADLVIEKIVMVREIGRDRYGRIVALVLVENMNINRELVAAGLAWVYTRYCQDPLRSEWNTLEQTARQERRGLWAAEAPTPPWSWRRQKRPNKADV